MTIRDSALPWVVRIALSSLLQLVRISDLGVQPPLGEEEPTREDKGEGEEFGWLPPSGVLAKWLRWRRRADNR